ncbi:MAG: periplasmic heavy metal sensor [Deltaproteobacteria bacterium]|nr:MAG: periplasmic heavy metal sensor [Deltaproteobacteria bacterium]
MKKLATTLGILVLVAVLAAPVFAHRWGKGESYGGPGYCWRDSQQYGSLTESQRAELDKLEQNFFNDTAKLREEIWTKSAELNTMLNSANPDANKVRALQKDISNLRAKMSEKRVNFELEARKISPNARSGRGYGGGYGYRGHHGPHYGHHGQYYGHHGPYGYRGQTGGYGPGACWN